MEPLRGLHKEIPSAGAIATRFHLVGELMVVWERNVDHQAMHHDNAFNGNNDNNGLAARSLERDRNRWNATCRSIRCIAITNMQLDPTC
jgi:hypothetical protein